METIHPTQLEAIQQKRRETCKVKYGVDHPWKSREFIEKLKLTYEQSIGHWPGQDSESIAKRKQTNIEKYGVVIAASFTGYSIAPRQYSYIL